MTGHDRHPNNPAVLAAGDATGTISVWDVKQGVTEPLERFVIPDESTRAAIPAIQRCDWSPDGRLLLVGDSIGRLHVYNCRLPASTASKTISTAADLAALLTHK